MRSNMIISPKNWAKVDISNPEHRRKVMGAVQHFMVENENAMMRSSGDLTADVNTISAALRERFSGQAQNFGADQFPDAVLQIIKTFQQVPSTAGNWTEFFEILDYTGTNDNGFSIADIALGLSFKEVPIGQKADLYGFKGQKASVTFQRFGGGMGWDRTLFDDRQFLTLDMIAREFTLKALNHKNDLAFSLLNAMTLGGSAAASVTDITWQAVVPSGLASTDPNYTAIRDMETISKAASTLIAQLKGKGYGVTESTQLTLMFPVELRTRILRALGILNAGISGTFQSVMWNIKPVMTTDLTVKTEWLMGLPGQKNLWANRMNLTVFDKFDPSSYSDAAYGWMRYAGAIGDFDQFVVGKTS